MDVTKRNLLKAAAALALDQWIGQHGRAFAAAATESRMRKVIIVACGAMRRSDTFSLTGLENIPRLKELRPQSAFFSFVRNAGVTSHFNTISSILTGNWQRLDDWGKTPPQSPTVFKYLRKRIGLSRDQVWLISSNKALTSMIGASSVREFGPALGANVIFPKQLLINAVVRAAQRGHAIRGTDHAVVQPEMDAMLSAQNYEGLGWTVNDTPSLNSVTLATIRSAIKNLVRTNSPVTGDEFTFLVSAEVMRRFAPSFLVVTFSDMEVAHFGSYSMCLSGIRTVDRLIAELWSTVQTLPGYKDNTTLFVLPEFGRDPDGSVTNGFFNHRQDGLTNEERRSAMTLWVIANAPLYLGDDLTQLDTFGLHLLTNDAVLAVDQSGVPGIQIQGGITPAWVSNVGGGVYYVALFNLDSLSSTVSLNWSSIGFSGSAAVRDLWNGSDLEIFNGSYSTVLNSHDAQLLQITAWNSSVPGVTAAPTSLELSSSSSQATSTLTVTPGGSSATLGFACSNLSASLQCSFTPSTLPLAGVTSPQAVTLTVSKPAISGKHRTLTSRGSLLACTLLLVLFPPRKHWLQKRHRRKILPMLLLGIVCCGLCDCGSSSIVSTGGGPSSIYSFNVNVSSGSALIQTISFWVSIQ